MPHKSRTREEAYCTRCKNWKEKDEFRNDDGYRFRMCNECRPLHALCVRRYIWSRKKTPDILKLSYDKKLLNQIDKLFEINHIYNLEDAKKYMAKIASAFNPIYYINPEKETEE